MPESNMKTLWILHKASGVCLYHQEFDTSKDALDVDTDLFGGFVTALIGFSKEVSKGKAELKEIVLGPIKIVYNSGDLVIVTIAFNQNAPRPQMNELLRQITTRFLDKFANRLQPEKFDNCTTPYKAFQLDIAELFPKEGKEVKNSGKYTTFAEGDYAALHCAVKDYLSGNQQSSFNTLDETLKEKAVDQKQLQNTLNVVKKFANRLGIETNFEPLFQKIRANTLSDSDEYAAFK